MTRSCNTLDQVVADILQVVADDKAMSRRDDDGAEYFFRGEQRAYPIPGRPATAFDPVLDRFESFWKHERELYEEAMRLNVASFTEDRTMCERIARMQHYRLPTRFADLSVNALLPTLFACGGCSDKPGGWPDDDGFIKVFKVAKHKMKSFTSDIIVAISHLPLVDNDKINPVSKRDVGYLVYETKNERPAFYRKEDDDWLHEELCNQLGQVWAFKPLMNNPRIRNQGGLFLAFGCRDGKEPLRPTFSLADYDNPTAPSFGIAQVGFVRIAAKANRPSSTNSACSA
ncbi:MAG: FRG domain-containing protein [Kiritimatiellae bacterium]|nr:FRG domain-containing protein [Kiritimatiellia bacterium]